MRRGPVVPRGTVRHGGRFPVGTVPGDRYVEAGTVEREMLAGSILVFLLSGLAVVVWHVLRHPLITGAALLLSWSYVVLGPNITGATLCSATAVLAVWSWRWPNSFESVVANRAIGRWRSWWVYRRRWQPAMTLTGLTAWFGTSQYVPQIRRVRSDSWRDHVLVKLLPGQAPEHFEAVSDELAHTFRVRSCRVRVQRPGRVWLDFVRSDPLDGVIDPLPVPPAPDLNALQVGACEDGSPWSLQLLGSHLLVAGATGSGKSSVVWSLVRTLGRRIAEGSVQLWVVDPKGGMELAPGLPLFTRFACTDPIEAAVLLEDAQQLLQERASRLRGVTRLHEPTPDDPLIVVVVDEIAGLTAYLSDREIKRRIAQSLGVLLSQGRAAGVLVVAAVQDPRKEVLPFRDLFPTRVALRLTEAEQVDLVLGEGARDRGAECDRIPVSQPGVGYALLDGQRDPIRIRAANAPDDALIWLTQSYPSPTSLASTADDVIDAALQEWAP